MTDDQRLTLTDQEVREFEIGDIIYLKCDIDSPFEDDGFGLVVGDGISSNKLKMLGYDFKYKENAYNQFRKCLFRIENVSSYVMAEQ